MRNLKRTEWTFSAVLTMTAIVVMLAGSFQLFAADQAMTGGAFAREFVPSLEHSKTYTLQFADAMPEADYSFKPTPEIWSFAEQLVHIAVSNFWLAAKTSGEENPGKDFKAEGKTKAEIIDYIKKSYDYAEKVLSGLSDQDTTKINLGEGPLTKAQIFLLLEEHIAHHRGQMVIYLRLKGIKPPDFVGW